MEVKNPPKFSSEKDYQTYKRELTSWTKVTKHEKKHWGSVVALSLPEKDPSDIRRKVFAGVDVDAEDGFDSLIKYLDEEFKKDEVQDTCEQIRNLITHKKDPHTSMKAYISAFDAKYVLAQKAGLTAMPEEYLMFHLMENSGLSEHEYRLVMSGIDMSKKTELYKQAKASLIKFFASMRPSDITKHEETCGLPEMKLDTEDTLYAGGFRGGYRGGRGGYRGGQQGRGGYNQGPWRNSNPQPFNRPYSKPINPNDREGKPQLCHSCGSFRHLQAACPDRYEAHFEQVNDQAQAEQNQIEEVADGDHFVGFNTNEFEIFAATIGKIRPEEVFACVVIDTGCVKSVAGRDWFNDFCAILSSKTKSQIKVYNSEKTFKFGGDLRKKSLGFYEIPCSLGGQNILLKIDVVDADIPCLISKEALKRGKVKIDVENDLINIFGRQLKLNTTDSGHYIMPIDDIRENVAHDELQVFVSEEALQDEKFKEKELERIHRALGHPSRPVLEKMLIDSNAYSDSTKLILNKIYEKCLTCFKYKRSNSRPKVSPPMASNVNHTVCMDLKISNKHGIIILYIIDMYSRFTVATIIPDKRPENVIDALLDKWVLTLFGAPERLLTDSGGEFHNHKLKDLCENFNIKLLTSGAYSPFQNGLCESNHKLVDNIMDKMLEDDPTTPLPRALSQAVLAKNMLVNHHGFSPLQLVTGQQPKLPSALDNMPPAMESVSVTQNVRNRINEIFSARKAFTAVENSKRLNKALQVKTFPKFEHFEIGTSVFYKHGKNPYWQGPAKVIGQDGKVIIIRQGRFILSTSQTRLLKYPKDDTENPVDNSDLKPPNSNLNVQDSESEKFPPKIFDDDSSDEEEEPITVNQAPGEIPEANDINQSEDHGTEEQVDPNDATDDALDGMESAGSLDTTLDRRLDTSVSSLDEDEDVQEKQLQELIKLRQVVKENPKMIPRKNQKIILRTDVNDPNAWKVLTVLSRGNRSNAKRGPYMNVMDRQGREFGVYIDEAEWQFVSCLPDRSDSVLNYVDESDDEDGDDSISSFPVNVPRSKWGEPEVLRAMELEIENFKKFEAFKLVPDHGQERLTSSWVITEKPGTETGIKARLVLHGNQEDCPTRTDSPTVRKTSLRLQIALAVQNGWRIRTADVKAAFLQSNKLTRDVFVEPVKEAAVPGMIWQMLKPGYGLADASHKWYETLSAELVKLGCQKLHTDHAVFYYIKRDRLCGIVSCHVDDLQITANEVFDEDILKPIFAMFKFGSIGDEDAFKVLGWDIVHEADGISVSQGTYIGNNLDYLLIEQGDRSAATELSDDEKTMIRAWVGKLRWVSDQTRPDISFDELLMSILQSRATYNEVKYLNKMVKKVKDLPYSIKYPKLDGDIWFLTVFADASLKNLPPNKTGSAGGFIIFLSCGLKLGQRTKCCPLAWKSTKIKRVVSSTHEAESLSLAEGLEEALVLKDQIVRMTGIPENLCLIECYIDNQDAVSSFNSSKQNQKGGRIQIDAAKVREMLETKAVHSIQLVSNTVQVADAMTKKGAPTSHLINTLENGRFFY